MKARQFALPLALACAVAAPSGAKADGLEARVELTYDHTIFRDKAAPAPSDFGVLSGRLSFGGNFDDRWSTNLVLYGRTSDRSGNGSYAELNEGWLRFSNDQLTLTAGVDVVAWPTLEFFQNTDFINQRDFSTVERERRKIGQPMVRAEYYAGDVLLEAYVLPRFTQPIYAGTASRFGNPLPVLEQAVFDDANGRNQPAFAARAEYTGTDFTLGGFAYHGYQMNPALLTVATANGPALQQSYATGNSFGIYGNLLWDAADAILKAQAVRSTGFLNRSGTVQDYTVWGIGIEKEFATFFADGTSATVVAEYTHDTRGALSTDPYPKGIALGLTVDFHDPASTKLGLSVTQNTNGDDRIWRLEFERRLTDHATMNIQANLFSTINPNGVLADLAGDSNLQFGITARF